MTGRIFHLSDQGEATPLEEQSYDAEKTLQELLAKHPDLLAGDQIDTDEPRRWLLVTREMAVPDEEEGPGRWSLDHLFLDQDAIPTLVEVKQSTNTDIRRKVVGQMLDYAANAVVYWPVEQIRTAFERRFEGKPSGLDEELTRLLGVEYDAAEFWQQVKTNLQAGRIRLVFVADAIPAELLQVVEFLNTQMDPAQVLAVEVKQYVSEKGMKTLVPRVLGLTAAAETKKAGSGRSGRQWDKQTFFAALREKSGEAADVAQQILDWAESRKLRIWWGKGSKYGSFFPMLEWKDTSHSIVCVWTYGRLEVLFEYMKVKPPFDDEQKRRELRNRLNEIFGADVILESSITKRPPILLSTLSETGARRQFLEVLDWVVEQIQST